MRGRSETQHSGEYNKTAEFQDRAYGDGSDGPIFTWVFGMPNPTHRRTNTPKYDLHFANAMDRSLEGVVDSATRDHILEGAARIKGKIKPEERASWVR